MKSRITFCLVLLLVFSISELFAQCIQNISTNPNNPVNESFVPMADSWDSNYDVTINSFLNTGFNWYPTAPIIIDTDYSWNMSVSNPDGSLAMVNPFGNSMPYEGFGYLQDPDSSDIMKGDFHWEDGWELLWMNLGIYPNGDSIHLIHPGSHTHDFGSTTIHSPSPTTVPYFVLYNRYRSLIRVFANLAYDPGQFDDVSLKIGFSDEDEFANDLTGIFRSASGYDLPLSQPTEVIEIHSQRMHAPGQNRWAVAEFQVAYDPCTCWSEGRLGIDFTAYNDLDVLIHGFSVAVEQQIDSTLLNENFLNISNINTQNYEPGTRVYRDMKQVYDDYRNQLEKYNDQMGDYMAWKNNIMRKGLEFASDNLTGGFSNVIVNDSLTDWFALFGNDWPFVEDADSTELEEELEKRIKKGLGLGFDALAGEMTKPKKPSTPVGTFEESVYKGEITDTHTEPTSTLFNPGSIPGGIGSSGTELTPYGFPAYNETLGLFALLDYPKFDYKDTMFFTFYESHYHMLDPEDTGMATEMQIYYTERRTKKDISFKLANELQYSVNEALDIDHEETTYQAMIELEFENSLGDSALLGPLPARIDPDARVFMTEEEFYSDDGYDHPVNALFEIDESVPHNMYMKHVIPRNNPVSATNKIVLHSTWYDFENLGDILWQARVKTKHTFLSHWIATYLNNWGQEDTEEGFYNPNDIYFNLNLSKVKLKLMPDFYFDQLGSDGKPVNTTQVRTFVIFDSKNTEDNNEDGDINYLDAENLNILNNIPDTLNEYHPGIITIESDTIGPGHPLVNDTNVDTLFIHAESILIDGDIEVESGYFLSIEGVLAIRAIPNSSIGQNIALRINKDHYPLGAMPPPLSSSEIANYCQGNIYSANSPSRSLLDRIEQQEALEEDKEEKRDKAELAARVYPNPSQGQFKTEIENLANGKVRLEIFSMSGLRVQSDETTTQSGYLEFTIDLSGQSNGLYILRITDSDGQTVSKRIQKL